jgi:very-short-patch-repair endonuclease
VGGKQRQASAAILGDMPTILARQLRRNATDAERRLWFLLRQRQLAEFRFRRQVPLGPYIVDFACLAEKLIVEVDGGQHNERQGEDAARTVWLAARGYRVMRFWNSDVLRTPEAVAEAILLALTERETPHPDPAPQGGRE